MYIEKPPMGWNSWNTFGEEINESLIREAADAIVKSGLKDAGYEYVIIDDCWALRERGRDGRMVPDHKKFPSGMKALAEYIHKKGLKFGMYSCAGTMTCASYPGSLDHEFIDAQTFAEWGVDYLKYDYCFKPANADGATLYRRMGLALANSGRDILFAACSWGADATHSWIRSSHAHTWRSTGDINDSFVSIKSIIEQQIPLLPYGGHGCFNDMDMLIVGMNGKGNVGLTGCTFQEYKLHFSAWALFASPLIIGCDVRSMDETTRKILLNRDVIAVNQDRGGRQVYQTQNDYGVHVFVRVMENGDVVVGLFNLNDDRRRGILFSDTIGLSQNTGRTVVFRDLWTDERRYFVNGTIELSVDAHDCVMMRGSVKEL